MQTHAPLYLLETINPQTGDTTCADVIVRLDTAIEKAMAYAKTFPFVTVSASLDENNVVEGVVFLDLEGFQVACITGFTPANDLEAPKDPLISEIVALPVSLMADRLTKLLAA